MKIQLKNITMYFGIVCFCQIQLAGLNETQLDLGPIIDWQVLKRRLLSQVLPKYLQHKFKMNCVESFPWCSILDIVLMTLFSMTWLFVK